jgi:hypothetical protein
MSATDEAMELVRRFQAQHPGKRIDLAPDGLKLVEATPEEQANWEAAVTEAKQHKIESYIARITDMVMDIQSMEREGMQDPVAISPEDYHELRTAEEALLEVKKRLSRS